MFPKLNEANRKVRMKKHVSFKGINKHGGGSALGSNIGSTVGSPARATTPGTSCQKKPGQVFTFDFNSTNKGGSRTQRGKSPLNL